jgi:hypothetical protein
MDIASEKKIQPERSGLDDLQNGIDFYITEVLNVKFRNKFHVELGTALE